MSRRVEIIVALLGGSGFVAVTGFASGILAARWFGTSDAPDRFWWAMGGCALVIAALWFSLLARDVRSMDWR